MQKCDVDYFYCENCVFLQIEEPYWLNEAYVDSININDAEYIQRNIYFSIKLALFIYVLFDKKAIFLDNVGGSGFLVRLMRDIAFDFVWRDNILKIYLQ